MASILKTDKIEGVTASGTVQMPAGHVIQMQNVTLSGAGKTTTSTSFDDELDRIIDYKNEVKIMETMYDIDDDFIHYIIDNKFIRNISGHGNYAINFFNKFANIYKTVYYSANGEIIGSIQFDFKENLELLSESWYIGDNRKKIKEFREIYEPKTHRYITIEERVIKELRWKK